MVLDLIFCSIALVPEGSAMPVAKIDPSPPPFDQTLQPVWMVPRSRRAVSLSLRQIMILLVYCAIASLLGRFVYEDGSPLHVTFLGVWIGLGICYLGLWLAFRLGEAAIVGWITFVVGYIVVTASMMGILAIPAIPVVIGVLIYLRLQHRQNQQNGLLWVLATAADRQIPLAPGVEAFAQQSEGTIQSRAHALAVVLRQGKSLTEAVDWVPRVVAWDASVLIRVGEQTGNLAGGLREATDIRARRHLLLRDVFGRIGYLLLVIAVAQAIAGFCSYFIVPKYEAIFKDFGIKLPRVTEWFLIATFYFSKYAPWILLAEFVALVSLAFRLGGGGLQAVPLLGRLFRFQHKSLLLKALAMVVEARQPLDRALEVLAARYPNRRVRRKLRVAYNLVRSGASWASSLDGVGLIGPRDVGVLDAATRAGNLPWALRALAENGERRFAYRLQVWSHFLFLLAMIGLGVVVLFVAVALFSPLVHLIEGLT